MDCSAVLRPANAKSPSRRDLVLVVNRRASGVDAAVGEIALFLRERGARVDRWETGSVEELRRLWPDVAGRRVVLAGGDGTLHAAINLPSPLPELALIPAGGANNVARALGIPFEPAAAAELAVDGQAVRIDLIEARSEGRRLLAVEGASVGVHAFARAHYHAERSTDIAAALRAAWTTARRFRGATVEIAAGQTVERRRVAQVFVANLPLFGFGLHVAPDARPDDGLLDIVVRGWSNRLALLPMVVRLRRGKDVRSPLVHTWQAQHLTIRVRGSPVVCDTTVFARGLVELTAIPRALAIVAPPERA